MKIQPRRGILISLWVLALSRFAVGIIPIQDVEVDFSDTNMGQNDIVGDAGGAGGWYVGKDSAGGKVGGGNLNWAAYSAGPRRIRIREQGYLQFARNASTGANSNVAGSYVIVDFDGYLAGDRAALGSDLRF